MSLEKGISGNPAGRPRGIKDRRVKFWELLEPHAPRLIEKVVQFALEGDTTALRLCLERICPPIKAQSEPVKFRTLAGSFAEQGQRIIAAMGKGIVAPSEASAALQALATQARIQEIDELERRVAALEVRQWDRALGAALHAWKLVRARAAP
jgi:hypothetical protein